MKSCSWRYLALFAVLLFPACNPGNMQRVPVNENAKMNAWLITVEASANLKEVTDAITRAGGTIDEQFEPITMNENELVIRVFGSAELANKYKAIPHVMSVYPDSEMEPFKG